MNSLEIIMVLTKVFSDITCLTFRIVQREKRKYAQSTLSGFKTFNNLKIENEMLLQQVSKPHSIIYVLKAGSLRLTVNPDVSL